MSIFSLIFTQSHLVMFSKKYQTTRTLFLQKRYRYIFRDLPFGSEDYKKKVVGIMLDDLESSMPFRSKSQCANFHSIYIEFKHGVLTNDFVQKTWKWQDQREVFETFVGPMFQTFVTKKYPMEVDHFTKMLDAVKFTDPLKQFPSARKLGRKIIYHSGMTNSGKTYEALKRLRGSQSGAYLSPLRLLAVEIFNSLNEQDVKCNLLTGQESKEIPHALHCSSTVEMVNLDRLVDVAVIDEIQMIADPNRGVSWTKALLGICAKEVHLCGDSSAIEIITRLCKEMGEPLEIKHYERLNKLHVDESIDRDFTKLKERDCIVAFNRKTIFMLKKQIETTTNFKCCVVYGNLPSEMRVEQADLFNDLDSGYSILISTDAIGLGLNLKIKRVIFYQTKKLIAGSFANIPPSLVKQIAGRAGRKAHYEHGSVTTFSASDLPYVRYSIKTALPPITKAGYFPYIQHFEDFLKLLPSKPKFSDAIERFCALFTLHDIFFMTDFSDQLEYARYADDIELPFYFRWELFMAPVARSMAFKDVYLSTIRDFAASFDVIPVRVQPGDQPYVLEENLKIIQFYMYMSVRYPERFDAHRARQIQEEIVSQLSESLVNITQANKKPKKVEIIEREPELVEDPQENL